VYQKKIGISPKTIHKPFGNYSHGILNSKNGLLVTSGQLGINLDGSIPTSFSEQTNICFSNIFSIIKEAAFDTEDILRLNTFLTDRQNLNEYMKIRDKFFSNISVKPASTVVIVSGFTKEEFLVEIEATAQR
jgi:enamine deaminase RidA (YjgF/YER057c/UK114 family)